MNELGKKIKQAIQEEGFNICQVAKRVRLLKNNLSVILGPRGNPQCSTVKRILDSIGYEVILRKKG